MLICVVGCHCYVMYCLLVNPALHLDQYTLYTSQVESISYVPALLAGNGIGLVYNTMDDLLNTLNFEFENNFVLLRLLF